MKKELITQKGLKKLRSELDELIKIRRPEIAERIKEAVSFGELTENAEYTEVKEAQAFVEGRIMEIENTLRTAVIVSPASGKFLSNVQIGCAVELALAGQRKKFILVGKGEGDPAKGKISSDSPIGQAILGRGMGDLIMVATPNGSKQYKIVRIA